MSNDVNYINYTKRSLQDCEVVTLEIFDTPVDCVGGMICLNDISEAYYNETGSRVRVDNWKSRNGVPELIEYLSDPESGFYESEDEVIRTYRGNSSRAGTYVCRELAHSFASWCDVKYTAHVLRAFDQLVQGNFMSAHKTAVTVARPFIKLEWSAREERLLARDPDTNPEQHYEFLVSDVFYKVAEVPLVNAKSFGDYLYRNIGDSLILERILNALECAWLLGDAQEVATIVVDQFRPDPEFGKLEELAREYAIEHNV